MNMMTMRAHKLARFLLTIAPLLFITGCSSPLPPNEVAAEFWAAIENQDARAARKLVTEKDKETLADLEDVLPISNTELGRLIIDGTNATVETKVSVSGERPINFPLNTYLVKNEDKWRVDYEKTIAAVSSASKLAMVIDQVRQFGSALQDGIDRSVEELEKSLPHIENELSRMEEQIKQQVPELREKLQNFAEELERALVPPESEEPEFETPKPVPAPSGPIKI